ncbi:MAG TPA: hypothetical protein VFX83_12070, partial [Azonexus sp.]|nr:hypothetical protein [Azonexus sp.]
DPIIAAKGSCIHFFMFRSLFDRVATAFHAGAIGPIEGVDLLLMLSLRLLVLGFLVLASAMTSGHGSDDRTDGGALAGIAGNRANRHTAESAPRSTLDPLATARCRTGLLGRWCLRHDNRIDAGGLLGPRIARAVVTTLLRRALSSCRIDKGLLRHGREGHAQGCGT